MGLQIALAFDLGVLADYEPSTEIDPIRDRFIGIILGIVIISTVLSLVWPEKASPGGVPKTCHLSPGYRLSSQGQKI